MSTTARLGIDIVGTNKTLAAFMSVQRSVQAFEKQASRLKTVFVGMFAGLAGGNLIKNFAQSMVTINKHVEPVGKSFTTMGRAWQQFALNVGKGGLNDALINFNNSISGMTVSLGGLSGAIGSFMGSTLNELTKGFVYTGRAIAFVGDNIEYLKGKLGSFSLSDGLFSGAIVSEAADAKILEWMKSMGLNTRALTSDTNGANAALSKLPPTFEEMKKSGEGAETAFEKLTKIKQLMFESTRTPMEKYLAGMRELDVVQASLGMSADLYARQQAKLREAFLGTGKTVKDASSIFKDVGQVFSSSFSSAFQSIIDRTASVKEAFSSMIQSILSNLTNLFANKAMEQLFDGGTSGGSGILGSLFKGLGGMLGSSGGGVPAASFNGLYAKGGTLGAGKWGIAGEAGPEIIQGPANVIPFSKMGGTTIVNQIIDQRGSKSPPIEQQQGSDGSMKFFIKDEVNRVIGSGGADKTMNARFGVSPRNTRR